MSPNQHLSCQEKETQFLQCVLVQFLRLEMTLNKYLCHIHVMDISVHIINPKYLSTNPLYKLCCFLKRLHVNKISAILDVKPPSFVL